MLQDMVRSGDVEIIPKRFEKGYFGWVDNLRDWCISRQIWWGHRIPVWYKEGEMHVGEEAPSTAGKPEGEGWQQDPDTLDTWFSSGLWTWSTLLDPEKKELDLREWFTQSTDRKFHPTQVLETGYDILTFWVIRMMLMTGYALDEVPFEKVYLHGLVRDKLGRKMSKSLDNGIDPIEVIEKYGADAVRLSLVIGSTPGNDVRVYDEKIANSRNFVNKLWNIGRYILMSVEKPHAIHEAPMPKSLSDKNILSKFQKLIVTTTEQIEKYQFSYAGENLFEFTKSELADWYVEDTKVEGKKSGEAGSGSAGDEILLYILTNLVKLWHPYMPYVTEVLYAAMGEKDLITAEWPQANDQLIDEEAEKAYARYKEVVTAIRNARAEFQIAYSTPMQAFIEGGDEQFAELIKAKVKLDELTFGPSTSEKKSVAYYLSGGITVHLPVEGLIDFEKEKERLQKELEKTEKYKTGIEKKLSNKGFVDNAPEAVLAEEKQKLEDANKKEEGIKQQLEALS
jgi:valyl-tRNA synthetase